MLWVLTQVITILEVKQGITLVLIGDKKPTQVFQSSVELLSIYLYPGIDVEDLLQMLASKWFIGFQQQAQHRFVDHVPQYFLLSQTVDSQRKQVLWIIGKLANNLL